MADSGVCVATTAADREAAVAVRRAVFVEGQGIPEDREIDGKDGDAVHFVAYDDGNPIGAARLRELDPDTAKAERVAVVESRRGEGWGRRLMAAVEDEARDRGCSKLVLHAQRAVETFYHDLGYRTVSDEFEDAGIPHVEMERTL